jgi:hypothetical protein
MENLVFVKKENKKTGLEDKKQAKSVFLHLSKSRGITLIALVISIIVILILAGISLNATIGDSGIISNAQNSKLKSQIANVESEILSGIATLDSEYYPKVTANPNIKTESVYNMSGLQKYVNGKINGFTYSKDGESVVYYTNDDGSYTVKINDGKATTYSGIYVEKDETARIYMSDESGNNTVQLSTNLTDVRWYSSDENIATVDSKKGIVTKNQEGKVTIRGINPDGEEVNVIIKDDNDVDNVVADAGNDNGNVNNGDDLNVNNGIIDDNGQPIYDEVDVVETKESVNIGATESDSVVASIVTDKNGETVLQISGTGNMFESAIELSNTSYYSEVTNIVIEDGVTNITEAALTNFTKAKSITIGKDVELIDEYYLYNQVELKTINMNAKNANINPSAKDYSDYYADDSEYYFAYGIENLIIGEDVEIINACMFYNYSDLKNVTISNGVKEIGKYAFAYCGCTTIEIPNSVKTIGNNAFYNAQSLSNVFFEENGTEEIGFACFGYCLNLKSVSLSNSLKNIGDYAFYGCGTLSSIKIPENVESIGQAAFNNCTSLTIVYYNAIAAEYTGIDYSTFGIYPLFYNSPVGKIIIGDKVTQLGDAIFSYLSNLVEITLPESLESLGAWVFLSCSNLNTVYYNPVNCVNYFFYDQYILSAFEDTRCNKH